MNTTAKMRPKILYGCGADSYYAIKMDVPDPYLWYQGCDGQTHVIMSPLEVDRATKHAQVDHVHSMADVANTLQAEDKPRTLLNMALWLIRQDDATDDVQPDPIQAPRDFPFALASGLQQEGVALQPAESFFFPERAIKTREEVNQIRQAQALNEQAFTHAFAVLAESQIGPDGTLYWQQEVLTAEKLRGQMNAVIATGGGMPSDLIIACGAQGADPHERGHGPLKAHELIVIDSFPRGPSGNFYHGDLTRTVLKGTPTKEQQKLFQTVKQGQQKALDMLSAQVAGADVHSTIEQHFAAQGYTTGLDSKGRNTGFFHGTGHSIGLEVHDQGPGISRRRVHDEKNQQKPPLLQAGLVVTVEPGLYYPDLGGVRIEDIVHITENGIENLTSLPKELVIA